MIIKILNSKEQLNIATNTMLVICFFLDSGCCKTLFGHLSSSVMQSGALDILCLQDFILTKKFEWKIRKNSDFLLKNGYYLFHQGAIYLHNVEFVFCILHVVISMYICTEIIYYAKQKKIKNVCILWKLKPYKSCWCICSQFLVNKIKHLKKFTSNYFT